MRKPHALAILVAAVVGCADAPTVARSTPEAPRAPALAKSGSGVTMLDLGIPAGFNRGDARAVHQGTGTIVGFAMRTTTSPTQFRALRWLVAGSRLARMDDLTAMFPDAALTSATAVNASGDIAVSGRESASSSASRGYVVAGGTTLVAIAGACDDPTSVPRTAAGLNDRGEVVGAGTTPAGDRAFYWPAVAACAEVLPGPGAASRAYAINEGGTAIIGSLQDPVTAVWQPVRWTRAARETAWSAPELLGSADVGGTTGVHDVGEDGTAVGGWSASQYVQTGACCAYFPGRAYRWAPGATQPIVLPSYGDDARVYGISATTGEMVGESLGSWERAALWSADGLTIRDLGVLAGGTTSAARAIHGRWVVGYSYVKVGPRATEDHPVLWTLP